VNFKFGGGVSFTLEATNFGIKLLIRVGRLLQQDAIQVSSVRWEFKVRSLEQGLVIEVCTHVVGDGHNEGSEVGGVALKVVGVFKQFKLDKVSIHAMRK
jgi:hypothetical protein